MQHWLDDICSRCIIYDSDGENTTWSWRCMKRRHTEKALAFISMHAELDAYLQRLRQAVYMLRKNEYKDERFAWMNRSADSAGPDDL